MKWNSWFERIKKFKRRETMPVPTPFERGEGDHVIFYSTPEPPTKEQLLASGLLGTVAAERIVLVRAGAGAVPSSGSAPPPKRMQSVEVDIPVIGDGEEELSQD